MERAFFEDFFHQHLAAGGAILVDGLVPVGLVTVWIFVAAKENFAFAQAHGFILKEERHFLKEADKTFLIEAKQFDTQRAI